MSCQQAHGYFMVKFYCPKDLRERLLREVWDLSSPLIGEAWIENHWHTVEYENLHLICGRCDRYDHVRLLHNKKLKVVFM